jgi:mannose-1-phosphate guanylyltransferase
MAGGVGARFWPMSRTSMPKQFIDILGTGETLIRQTYRRFLPVIPNENIFIVTNEAYAPLVREQIPELPEGNIITEPVKRNTAPCVAYAAYKLKALNPEANLVVAPSDHVILKEEFFSRVISLSLKASVAGDKLITLGIHPNRPDTGYGYIQYMDPELSSEAVRLHKVRTFTEKPNLEIARTFLASGDFLWNSGIFIWKADAIIAAFEQHLPDMAATFGEGHQVYNSPDETEFISRIYPVCESISIDYGVMEKADNVYVFPADLGWSDLGTWGSLYQHRTKDPSGNAIMANNAMLYDCKGCIVNMPSGKLTVLQGLEDYIVVEDNNTLLVCRKGDEQQIRLFVNDVKINKGERFI